MGVSYNWGRWSVGARSRYFGPRALIKDNSVRSTSSFLLNLKLGYRVLDDVWVFVEGLNLSGGRVNDMDYHYASLLKGETSPRNLDGVATGINDQPHSSGRTQNFRVGVLWNFLGFDPANLHCLKVSVRVK
ncbi:hypothetical protein EV147_1141 [Cupriavidus agavae]|uniref:TonB-dependent receptor n=1 Tax=Cupriavidus agavae TaxID=1001822 RepID=A0A4Q7S9I2_9BURK|nr:hypothetical protein EV147_1141 [Cupriavidus agavae]